MGAQDKKMASDDKVLVLSPLDGKAPLSSHGVTDSRLFTGENKLHAIKDPQTCFWYLKYEMGVIPPPLQQKFTGFNALLKHTRSYYNRRNIDIKEIID